MELSDGPEFNKPKSHSQFTLRLKSKYLWEGRAIYVCDIWSIRRSETRGPSPEEKHCETLSPPPLSPHTSWEELASPDRRERGETQTSHCFGSSLQQSLCRGRPQSTISDYLLILISACRTSLFPLVVVYGYYLICFWDHTTIFFSGISHFFHRFLHTHTHTHILTHSTLIGLTEGGPSGIWKLTEVYQHFTPVSQSPSFLPSLVPLHDQAHKTHPPCWMSECKTERKVGGVWNSSVIIFKKCLILNSFRTIKMY